MKHRVAAGWVAVYFMRWVKALAVDCVPSDWEEAREPRAGRIVPSIVWAYTSRCLIALYR